MIISNNRQPSILEFTSLLTATTNRLNEDAHSRGDYYLTRGAQLLEDDVMRVLIDRASGTAFAGTIQKISGQRFPDIVAGKYYGVEVKSSKDDKWTTLGGSVNESTRVEGVERIFLTFGKLQNPIEFRSRPYEDCLSDVVVTHYPRYKIDMNLNVGETIFDRMDTSYDDLRSQADPVGRIVDYYKSQLAEGESLWWTGKAEQAVPAKIRLLRTLSVSEKHQLMILGFAYFPDVLSNSHTKYERFSLWLVANYGVVSTSMRDLFSAGGQATIETPLERFEKTPRAMFNVFQNKDKITEAILTTDKSVLLENWRVSKISNDRIGQWSDCVINSYSFRNDSLRYFLNSIFNRR